MTPFSLIKSLILSVRTWGYILIRKLLKMIYSEKHNPYYMPYFDTAHKTSYDNKMIFMIDFMKIISSNFK